MITAAPIVDAATIVGVGTKLSGSATTAAAGIILVTAPIAFGVAVAKHAAGGRHPFGVLLQIAAVCFGLAYYNTITSTVANLFTSATFGKLNNFQQLLSRYGDDIELKYKPNPQASNGDVLDQASDFFKSFSASILSAVLTVIGMLAVLIALNLYNIIQAVLYGVLVAVGPLMIAVCLVPGFHGLFGRWLSALFELATWKVVGAIVFEMIGGGLLKLMDSSQQGGNTNFVSQFVGNIAMVFCVCLIPKISSWLAGSGFGSIGGTMLNAAIGAARTVASVAAPIASAAIGKGANALGDASEAAIASMNAPRLYQPPASGGPSGGGLPNGPELAEREMMSARGPGAAQGAESFNFGDAKTDPNLINRSLAPDSPGPNVNGGPAMDPSNFAGVEADKWHDFDGFGGNNKGGARAAPLASVGDVPGPSGQSSDAKGANGGKNAHRAASSHKHVDVHAVAERNADFKRMFPNGEMKDGIFFSPDKVRELKRQGKW